MLKYREGEWYVLREKTTKPFERIKIDASRGLLTGLSAFFTTHEWRGHSGHISSSGAEGVLTYRVVIPYNGQCEIPSDILGVVYVEFKASVLETAERIRLALKRVELLEPAAGIFSTCAAAM